MLNWIPDINHSSFCLWIQFNEPCFWVSLRSRGVHHGKTLLELCLYLWRQFREFLVGFGEVFEPSFYDELKRYFIAWVSHNRRI